MAITAPPSIDAAPTVPQRGDRLNFATQTQAWIAWEKVAYPQNVAVGVNVYNNALEAYAAANLAELAKIAAQAAAATAATGAPSYVNGQNVPAGAIRLSTVAPYQPYYRKAPGGVSVIEPSADTTQTDWAPWNHLLKAPAEVVNIVAAALTGAVHFDLNGASVQFRTVNASANWTLNFRWSATTSLDSMMAVGEMRTVTLFAKQGGTAYYPTAFTIDGVAVVPKWAAAAAPVAGNINSDDAYSFSILKTAAATFSVRASVVKFA